MNLKKILLVAVGILVIVIGFFWNRPINKQNFQMKNQVCPVSGNPVNGSDTYIHQGKEYNLCGEKCKQPLSENPEKYLSE